MFRATINITGMKAGEVLEKTRNIIPAEVIVEFDFRLVVNQTPEKIKKLISNHFKELETNPEFIKSMEKFKYAFHNSYYPFKTNIGNKWTSFVKNAIINGFNCIDPILIPVLGGSLPTYHFQNILQVPVLLIPYAQPDENIHGRNENVMLKWFKSDIKTSFFLLTSLSSQ
jgi:acetylornithine deacetylase/succinyl-diaminopimelate desuccinylase-like protein